MPRSKHEPLIFRSHHFLPSTLPQCELPELFSLGNIEFKDEQIAAVCPIFWEESIFIDGTRSAAQTAASFMESAALQIYSQAPSRVEVIVYDASLGSGLPALEAIAELFKSKSKESTFRIIRSLKEFEEIFSKLITDTGERKSRLAIDGLRNWKQILQQDSSSHAIFLLIRNPYDLAEKSAFEKLPEFMQHAPRMGILTWIDGTSKPDTNGQHHKTRIEEWKNRIKSSCHIRLTITDNSLSPEHDLLGFQPFTTYADFGNISPSSIDNKEQRAYIKSLEDQFSSLEQNQKKDFISVEIGKKNGQPFFLGIGPKSDVYHSLLAGATGSGKTVFLKHFLTLICEKYSSSEILIHLYDFKGGANLNFYRGIPNFVNLFECRANPELALQAFDEFIREAAHRQELIKNAQMEGMVGEDISAYNEWAIENSKEKLPAQLLIIDELGQLYEDFRKNEKESWSLRTTFNRKIEETARQGRSQGMFLLLSSQHFDDIDIDGALGNTQLKMSMRLDKKSQCIRIFEGGNYAAFDLRKTDQNAPRDILINCASGRASENQIIRLPLITHEALTPRLRALQTRPKESTKQQQKVSDLKEDEYNKQPPSDNSNEEILRKIFPDLGDLPEIP